MDSPRICITEKAHRHCAEVVSLQAFIKILYFKQTHFFPVVHAEISHHHDDCYHQKCAQEMIGTITPLYKMKIGNIKEGEEGEGGGGRERSRSLEGVAMQYVTDPGIWGGRGG